MSGWRRFSGDRQSMTPVQLKRCLGSGSELTHYAVREQRSRMLPVDYLPEARIDFDESFDWYAERSTQAAVRFANAVDAALSAIATSPERFASVDEVHQECPVKR